MLVKVERLISGTARTSNKPLAELTGFAKENSEEEWNRKKKKKRCDGLVIDTGLIFFTDAALHK